MYIDSGRKIIFCSKANKSCTKKCERKFPTARELWGRVCVCACGKLLSLTVVAVKQPFGRLPCLSHLWKTGGCWCWCRKAGWRGFPFRDEKRPLFSLPRSQVSRLRVFGRFSSAPYTFPRSIFKAVKEFSFCVPLASGLSQRQKKVFHTGLGKCVWKQLRKGLCLEGNAKLRRKVFVLWKKTRIFSRFSVFRRRDVKARKEKDWKGKSFPRRNIQYNFYAYTHWQRRQCVDQSQELCVHNEKFSKQIKQKNNDTGTCFKSTRCVAIIIIQRHQVYL